MSMESVLDGMTMPYCGIVIYFYACVTCFVDAMLASNDRLHPKKMFRNSHSSRTVSSSRILKSLVIGFH
jgi:hypothetical protein